MSEMEKYMTKSKSDRLAITGFGAAFLAVGCFLFFGQKSWVGLLFAAAGVLVMYSGLTAGASDQAAMQKMRDEGILSEAEADFASE